jgi:hypothetical protein
MSCIKRDFLRSWPDCTLLREFLPATLISLEDLHLGWPRRSPGEAMWPYDDAHWDSPASGWISTPSSAMTAMSYSSGHRVLSTSCYRTLFFCQFRCVHTEWNSDFMTSLKFCDMWVNQRVWVCATCDSVNGLHTSSRYIIVAHGLLSTYVISRGTWWLSVCSITGILMLPLATVRVAGLRQTSFTRARVSCWMCYNWNLFSVCTLDTHYSTLVQGCACNRMRTATPLSDVSALSV